MNRNACNQPGEWVNLYGKDGKIKGRYNAATMELVVKERGVYHSWRLASMGNGQKLDDLPVELSAVAC